MIPNTKCWGFSILFLFLLIYILIWLEANLLTNITINIDGSTVNIKSGDLFEEQGFKVIPFNEYFDTQVDDKIIANSSLNGIFIKKYLKWTEEELDTYINENTYDKDVLNSNSNRKFGGKIKQFKLSTIIVYKDYFLTAFSKFNEYNMATLTMPEYLEFLVNFWDGVNRNYAQKPVSVPIFWSWITRISYHKNIPDEELLKIMLWTFKLSEIKFEDPARLTIVIHKDKISQINLFEIKKLYQN